MVVSAFADGSASVTVVDLVGGGAVRGRPWPWRELVVLGPAAAVAVVFTIVAGGQGWPIVDPGIAPWWILCIAFVGAEAYVVTAGGRLEATVLSPHDAAVAIGLFLLGPVALVASQLAGAAIALVLLRQWRPDLLVSRLVILCTGASVAVLVFRAIGRLGDLGGKTGWAAVFGGVLGAALAMAVVSRLAARAGGRRAIEGDEPGRALLLVTAGAVASASLAIAAVELIRAERLAALLLLVPFLSCALALRAYTFERRRLTHLRLLYDSMRAMHRAPGLEAGVLELLGTTRSLFGADVAWVALLPRRRATATLVAGLAPEGELSLRARELTDAQAAAVQHVAGDQHATLLESTRADATTRGLLAELRVDRAMVTPLRGDADVLGVLVVGRRDVESTPFADGDVRLFETYASHVAILLENDRLEQSVNELEALKEQLRHQAYHDTLTGLPNRALFSDSVARVLDRESGASPAVLFLDLDDFKMINDSLGHHAGDELLQAMAGRVRGCVRAGDIPARLGGDEFAVLTATGGAAEAEKVAERLVQALDQPFVVGGREMSVHASVGIAVGRPGVTSAEELLRNADVAMYDAKQEGKRRYVVYEPQMHTRVQRRQELATALERAAERGEIAVHYQPIVGLDGRALNGVEALARWQRPLHGLLAPTSFIPLADEMGLMVGIGRVVLRAACVQARSWQVAFPSRDDLRINVNLAPSELHDPDLAREVERVLDETGLEPGRLVLEITESGVMRSPERARVTMARLRQLGVSLSLDDFGTGHSSLAYLREFPLDQLKIAREFVAGLPEGHVDGIFVETIVRLASSLGLDVVAEGIESEAQAEVVAALGCRLGQGFFFGEPLSGLGVAEYLVSTALPVRARTLNVA